MESGWSDGTNMETSVTREQFITMLWRMNNSPKLMDYSNLNKYSDANAISDYAMFAMMWADEQGLIKGKGNNIVDPQGLITRAEMATILARQIID